MRKNKLVFLCICAAIITLCGGFFLIRAWLLPEVWVSFPESRGACTLTASDGTTLVYENGTISGTMEVLEEQRGIVFSSFRIPYCKSFTLETTCHNGFFGVAWGDVYHSFDGSGARQLSFSQSRVTVEGDLADYWLSISYSDGEATPRCRLSGTEAVWAELERSGNTATAESSSAYAFELRDLYTGEVFAHHDSPDGAAFTLHTPTE